MMRRMLLASSKTHRRCCNEGSGVNEKHGCEILRNGKCNTDSTPQPLGLDVRRALMTNAQAIITQREQAERKRRANPSLPKYIEDE